MTTVAGNETAGFSGDGGPATSASLNGPKGLAFDTAGNLYIADYDNRRIRKVTLSTGIITTHSSGFLFPTSITFDSSGNTFILELVGNVLTRINAADVIAIVAGIEFRAGYSGDNGPANQASFWFPEDVALDAHGNIFIADTLNSRIRAIKGPLP
jgi:sugar lactone lactonase YvrE